MVALTSLQLDREGRFEGGLAISGSRRHVVGLQGRCEDRGLVWFGMAYGVLQAMEVDLPQLMALGPPVPDVECFALGFGG